MKTRFILVFIFVLKSFSSEAQNLQASHLAVGSPIPAFNVGEWIKGTPVNALEKGKVNVIEFTIVGCGPCIKAIPHLTALNNKYKGTVNIVSVFVDGRNVPPVKRLVSAYSADVTYPVAVDTKDEFMKINWMAPTGSFAYPKVFVIDKQGKIAWIGNPLNEQFERIIDKVNNDSFDMFDYSKKEKRKNDEDTKLWAKLIKNAENGGKKEEKEVLMYLDSLISLDSRLLLGKFKFLITRDEEMAYLVARKSLNERVANGYLLGDFMHAIPYLKKPDFKVFRDICDFLYETENKINKAASLEHKASLYFLDGKLDSAILASKLSLKDLQLYNRDGDSYTGRLIEGNKRLNWYKLSSQRDSVENNYLTFFSLDTIDNGLRNALFSTDPNTSIASYNSRAYGKKGFKTFRPQPLSLLYKLAYLGQSSSREDFIRVLYDVKNLKVLDEYFLKSNKYFNFNLILPEKSATTSAVMKYMQQYLTQTFGFEGKKVKDSIAVWRLVNINAQTQDLRSKKPLAFQNGQRVVDRNKIILDNVGITEISDALRELNPKEFYKVPVINETNISYPIALSINLHFKNDELDLDAFKVELRKNGFDLVKGSKVMEVLLISDAKL